MWYENVEGRYFVVFQLFEEGIFETKARKLGKGKISCSIYYFQFNDILGKFETGGRRGEISCSSNFLNFSSAILSSCLCRSHHHLR